jgi:serine/threonine protein kinase
MTCLSEDQALGHAAGRGSMAGAGAVLVHLDACDRCRALVVEAVHALGHDEVAPCTPRTFADGELVGGRYRILRLLGAGGMGEVYEVRDGDRAERLALKTLAITILDDPRAVTRLRKELELARRVDHPNVCRVFDLGVHERPRDRDRTPFLTMELLAGETLAAFLDRVGPLGAAEAEPIVRQMVAGLAAVHQMAIVHRDLKSDNVFLVPSGQGAPRVVIMDFGLARSTARRPDGSVSASLSGRRGMIGTLGYMSPEQVKGHPATASSDIYALGLILYEMRTGRLPFEGETPIALAMARLRAPATPPSAHVPDLERSWDRAILRCLERDPRDRHPTVQDVSDALFAEPGPWARLLGTLRRR